MTLCGHSFCREGAQALVLSAVRCVMLKLSEVPSQMSFDPAKSVSVLLGHFAWAVHAAEPTLPQHKPGRKVHTNTFAADHTLAPCPSLQGPLPFPLQVQ